MKTLHKRPNTGVPDRYLSSDIILCAGEDQRELIRAVRQLMPEEKALHHQYRCFHFWKYSRFTLVLTGIGTGCLEPLIWELVESGKVRRIVLIGTAGYIGTRRDRHGEVYLIDQAFVAGTGVHVKNISKPIRPRFAGIDKLGLQRLSGIASDYYYALADSEDPRIRMAQASDPALSEGRAKVKKNDRLVDMETPQFYKLCEVYGAGRLEYVAIRGVANTVGAWEEQTSFAVAVLTKALHQAMTLLSYRHEEW